ncbi:hypothetical protein C8A01DRAFT_44252 [Parachaetomium inaequale]|uniref:F-box domain-containing protein n=1 Tax=Parachaetomium inaequale TaxID=2588326 RepID=A0AAN6SUM9_9PEZI|nr:hypothetical protein C8A01DRAFT_44252 [Parachaetomium inaequale]
MEHTGRIADSNGLVADLPSYQDATTRPDWLALVAPYLSVREYARLCLVSRRFYDEFAPHPKWLLRFVEHAAGVRTATRSNFVRSCDTRPFFAGADDAVSQHAGAGGTIALSAVLFSITCNFRRLRCIFLDGHPHLEPEPIVSSLTSDRLPPFEPPLLLSIARCQVDLPSSFFATPYLRNLVYLDVSDMPGSLKYALAQRTLSPANLPALRILKAQGREMDTVTATLLFKAFWEQLWSVDLSQNKFTDDVLNDMHQFSFPSLTSRGDYFAIEGRLSYCEGGSTSFGKFYAVSDSEWSATFSHPHRHAADAPPYFPPAEDGSRPTITPRLNGRVKIRSDSPDAIKAIFSGNAGSHGPSLESVQGLDICRGHQGITHLYLNGNNISAAGLARMIRSSPGQLQRLECDSISFKLPEAAPPSWLSRARLSGTLGWAHVFRPVFSANLQVLRIHHSLVTQLLSLELDGLSPLANLWVAETQLLPRAELAYPEAFVPDMNPRLQSLVLTRIPRYSAGPLVDKLIGFLKLASVQERAIQDVRTAGRHGPVTLLGLRHIRLEFEPDPREELGNDSDSGFDFDAAAVMDDAAGGFSFFGESAWSSLNSTAAKPSSAAAAAVEKLTLVPAPHNVSRPGLEQQPDPEPSNSNTSSSSTSSTTPQSARPPPQSPHPPAYSHANPTPSTETPASPGETETQPDTEARQHHTWTWNALQQSAQVWIGSCSAADSTSSTSSTDSTDSARSGKGKRTAQGKEISNSNETSAAAAAATVVQEYTRLVRTYPRLCSDPVPASPCHVAAGVPRGEYLFSAAWGSILCPPPVSGAADTRNNSFGGSSSGHGSKNSRTGLRKPTRTELRGMRDVVAAIKAYRKQTRGAYDAAKKEAQDKGEEVKLGEPHFHWGGRLEVEVDGGGVYHQSRYWR